MGWEVGVGGKLKARYGKYSDTNAMPSVGNLDLHTTQRVGYIHLPLDSVCHPMQSY